MLKKSIVLAVLMCAVVVLGTVDLANAQATETIKIRATGTLMGRSGDTIVVDVKQGQHLGMRRFSWKDMEGIKFYNQRGEEVEVHRITIGSTLTVEYTETREAPVVVTMTEIQTMEEHSEPASAPAAAPAPAPAPAPAELPSTASSLPLVLMIGLLVLAFATTLTIVRRS